MRTCENCLSRTLKAGDWVCARNTYKKADYDTPACAHYVPEDAHQCWECDYFDYGDDTILFKKKPSCQLKGTRANENDKACSKFFRT